MTGAGGTGTISIGATVVVVVDGWLKLCTLSLLLANLTNQNLQMYFYQSIIHM